MTSSCVSGQSIRDDEMSDYDSPLRPASQGSQPHVEQSPNRPPHRFGRLARVIADQPMAQVLADDASAIREQSKVVINSVYDSASRMLPASDTEQRLKHVEVIIGQLMNDGGTVDHIFQSMAMLSEQFTALREEIDCQTERRDTADTEPSVDLAAPCHAGPPMGQGVPQGFCTVGQSRLFVPLHRVSAS